MERTMRWLALPGDDSTWQAIWGAEDQPGMARDCETLDAAIEVIGKVYRDAYPAFAIEPTMDIQDAWCVGVGEVSAKAVDMSGPDWSEVAGTSAIVRNSTCPGGVTGRRSGLKSRVPKGSEGSSPSLGTAAMQGTDS